MTSHQGATATQRFKAPADMEDVLWWVLGLCLALSLRLSLFPFQSFDYIWFLSPWYDYMQTHGGFAALKDPFSNYTPPYLYLLWLATKLFIKKLYAIKLIAILFDFLLAFLVSRIVHLKYQNTTIQMLAFFAVLFAPTVVFNSALWGQCDAMYTSFLVAAVYYVIRKKPVIACSFFAVALSFKMQTIFLSPLLLVLYLKKCLPAWGVVLLPLIYFLVVIPAWIAGRPLADLMTIYVQQAQSDTRLTLNAPNLYQWLPDSSPFGRFAISLAATSVFMFCLLVSKSKREMNEELIVRLSLTSVLLVPFFLPRMHERYFFPAEVLAIPYAFYFPRYFFVPLSLGLISLFSYIHVLAPKYTVIELPFLALFMIVILLVVAVDTVRALYPLASGAKGPVSELVS